MSVKHNRARAGCTGRLGKGRGWSPLPGARVTPGEPALCCVLSRVRLSVTPWTAARRAPLSTGFSRQAYWSGLPCPPPGDLPDPGTQPASPVSPALAGRLFATEPSEKPLENLATLQLPSSWSSRSAPPGCPLRLSQSRSKGWAASTEPQGSSHHQPPSSRGMCTGLGIREVPSGWLLTMSRTSSMHSHSLR